MAKKRKRAYSKISFEMFKAILESAGTSPCSWDEYREMENQVRHNMTFWAAIMDRQPRENTELRAELKSQIYACQINLLKIAISTAIPPPASDADTRVARRRLDWIERKLSIHERQIELRGVWLQVKHRLISEHSADPNQSTVNMEGNYPHLNIGLASEIAPQSTQLSQSMMDAQDERMDTALEDYNPADELDYSFGSDDVDLDTIPDIPPPPPPGAVTTPVEAVVEVPAAQAQETVGDLSGISDSVSKVRAQQEEIEKMLSDLSSKYGGFGG